VRRGISVISSVWRERRLRGRVVPAVRGAAVPTAGRHPARRSTAHGTKVRRRVVPRVKPVEGTRLVSGRRVISQIRHLRTHPRGVLLVRNREVSVHVVRVPNCVRTGIVEPPGRQGAPRARASRPAAASVPPAPRRRRLRVCFIGIGGLIGRPGASRDRCRVWHRRRGVMFRGELVSGTRNTNPAVRVRDAGCVWRKILSQIVFSRRFDASRTFLPTLRRCDRIGNGRCRTQRRSVFTRNP
jgi:hypothetical protein